MTVSRRDRDVQKTPQDHLETVKTKMAKTETRRRIPVISACQLNLSSVIGKHSNLRRATLLTVVFTTKYGRQLSGPSLMGAREGGPVACRCHETLHRARAVCGAHRAEIHAWFLTE